MYFSLSSLEVNFSRVLCTNKLTTEASWRHGHATVSAEDGDQKSGQQEGRVREN